MVIMRSNEIAETHKTIQMCDVFTIQRMLDNVIIGMLIVYVYVVKSLHPLLFQNWLQGYDIFQSL